MLARASPAGSPKEICILAPKGCSSMSLGLCSYIASTGGGRDIWKSSELPCSCNVRWSSLLTTVSHWALSISKDGDSTTSLGILLQPFTTFTEKIPAFSLCLNRISCVSVCAHCPLSCQWIPLSLTPPSLFCLHRYLYTLLRFPESSLVQMCFHKLYLFFLFSPHVLEPKHPSKHSTE